MLRRYWTAGDLLVGEGEEGESLEEPEEKGRWEVRELLAFFLIRCVGRV